MAHVDISKYVHDYIHEGKQFAEDRTSALLTVGRIGRLVAGGALDFGGSEYAAAEVSWLEPQKQSPDDTYGWWQLSAGNYMLEFNESVSPPEGVRLLLHPWTDAVAAGVSHPVDLITTDRKPLRTLLSVGPQGLSIKENARISRISART